ncbi:hypothetical protein D049_5107 [Vibrio parahaemolyticus VPTS-2010]|nr:hypothetical protein D049_5107 [Vibrio parahaemolyticus VPTS-2010]
MWITKTYPFLNNYKAKRAVYILSKIKLYSAVNLQIQKSRDKYRGLE